jgi:hypothetical protein
MVIKDLHEEEEMHKYKEISRKIKYQLVIRICIHILLQNVSLSIKRVTMRLNNFILKIFCPILKFKHLEEIIKINNRLGLTKDIGNGVDSLF